MKVYVFPADVHGCGSYRLIWPAQQLQRDGHAVEIVRPEERGRTLQASMRGDKMVDVKIPPDADVIALQRVTHRYMIHAIEIIRRKGVAVVVDMDDDLTCIHPANPAFRALHPTGPVADHSWQNATLACDAATLVTTSTPALVDRYARRGVGRVLYNHIPGRYLDVPHVDSDVIGWPGSLHSHPTDLQVMGTAPAQLLREGCQLKIVGPGQGIHAALGVSLRHEIEFTGPVAINAWPTAVSLIGVGVAPLADTKFNTAKSWLKMLEMAAVGVPVVASPRVEYARLHRAGVGWLAKTPSEWRSKLRTLTESAEARVDLTSRGRDVARNFTIEANAWRWWEAWSEALKLERSHHLADPLVRSAAA